MLNLRTLILGQPRTCPQTGLQNEPRYSEKPSEFGTVNWTPYFEYNVVEDEIDLDELDKIKDNPDALDIVASSFTEDEDAHEFLGIIAISHSNIVITYEGRNTQKTVSIRIPYSVLKKYCKVPQFLLS